MGCEGYENHTGGPKGGMCFKDLVGAPKEGLLKKVNLHKVILCTEESVIRP